MNKLCLKIVQKALKWPLQYTNLQNFPREHALGSPRILLLLKLLIINSVGNKLRSEKVTKFGAPPMKKNFQCAPDIKFFRRTFLSPFPGLNVLASLSLVNTQPNLKLHPPHQNFLDPFLAGYGPGHRTVPAYFHRCVFELV